MNRSYRSLWNDRTGTFVAVAENTTSTGKKSSLGATAIPGNRSFALKWLAVSLMLAFGPNVYALPVGGVVTAGGAIIGDSVAGKTTITQSSQNVAINWQSFSIGATEAVQFVQPNSSSVALNRVLGADPSSILGSMSANGKVFLVNPNGILFGKGAQVNVGGLVASTLNISDSDFMAGKYQFSGSSGAAVLNQGSINADGGYVALLGANVGNDGTIVARLGTVALAVGNAITLDVAGDGLLNVTVNQGAVNALVQNGGLIQADGGQVLLTAKAAGTLFLSAVNNTGVIQAQTIENRNGTIRLLGDMQGGTVNVGGTLDASGMGAGQTGGSVTVTGHHVGLFGGHINASGDAGGGTVLIGGDYQGKNPAVQNASATYMSADSTITADAITNGDGGKVILWSDESTRAYGSITARGGALGGNGGLIETSGHWLDVWGVSINAGAPNGKGGMWLLDPADVTISAAADSNGIIAGGVFAPTSGSATANVDSGLLQVLLNAGTSVTITTTNTGVQGAPASGLGDINVNAVLTWTSGGLNSTLTLNAGGNVNINSAINATQGNLVVCCGIDINVNAPITMVRGSMLLSAGRNVNQLAAITSTDGNIAMCAGGDINVTAAMSSTRGTVIADRSLASLGVQQGLTFSAGNAATGPGLAGGGGAVNITPPGGTVTVVQSAVVGEEVPVMVIYNPLTYGAAVIDYSLKFTTFNPLTVRRLVFPSGANKVADGTTTATFTSFKPDINGLVPGGGGLTLAGGIANYDTTAAGVNKPITYSGFTLGGASAGFALPTGCCGSITRTTGTITAAALPVVPPLPPGVLPVLPTDTIAALASFPEELLRAEENITPYASLLAGTSVMPRVELAGLPLQLISVAPVVVPPPPPVVEEEAPPIYVPPVPPALPLKQDRN
jgi:filamentous hemagglutinin family protein